LEVGVGAFGAEEEGAGVGTGNMYHNNRHTCTEYTH
jgi:hypothetical protein